MGVFSKLFRAQKPTLEYTLVSMPIFHETLSFPLPTTWEIEPSQREVDGGKFLIEFCATEGSDDRLSVQAFNSANDDVELNARKLLKMMQAEMSARNEADFYSETLFSETQITKERLIVVMGLKKLPDAPTLAQFSLYMIIEGAHDIYIIQRSWKGTPAQDGFLVSREEITLWLEAFKTSTLSETVTPDFES